MDKKHPICGDTVEFEMDEVGSFARWELDIVNSTSSIIDRGSSGRYQRGSVIDLNYCNMRIMQIKGHKSGLGYFFPLPGHLGYREEQWSLTGFPRLASSSSKAKITGFKPCECSMDVLMTQGCKCGGR